MIDWQFLIFHALKFGLGLSLALTVFMLISGSVALDMFIDDYPPAIKEKYGPMSPRAARLRPYVAGLLFLIVLAVPVAGLFTLRMEAGRVPLLHTFVFAYLALLVFNIYDLLILDWLLFCTLQPRMMVLPGTEGMAAYHDYRFHFVGFLKGLVFLLVGSLVITVFWMILQGLTA